MKQLECIHNFSIAEKGIDCLVCPQKITEVHIFLFDRLRTVLHTILLINLLNLLDLVLAGLLRVPDLIVSHFFTSPVIVVNSIAFTFEILLTFSWYYSLCHVIIFLLRSPHHAVFQCVMWDTFPKTAFQNMPGAIRPAAPRPPFSTMRPASSQVPRVMSTQRVGEFHL